MCKLVGFKRFVSKKNGKEYCVANTVGPYSPREMNNGCYGQKVEELFLPEDQTSLLKESDIGKGIKLDYELSNGRAYLVSVTVVK